MRVLVANAGSSSLKLSLLDADDGEAWARELRTPLDQGAISAALTELPAEPDAVGHRVVHGGDRFRQAVRVDSEVERALRELAALAPLHQPKSLAALDAVTAALPEVPAVACFDTAFHHTLPHAAATYALPRSWRDRYGIRRYGFHGLSHAYTSHRARELAGAPARVVSCHLGAGASLCAIADGRSVDTTMGFTPLEGLVMATRSGSVDPGLLLWLQQQEGIRVDELAGILEHDSGLFGLAGTADMREVLARDDDDAQLAVGVYVHRLRGGIAAMVAALGGLDALVFTGGVGERAPRVRELACTELSYLGIEVDSKRNGSGVDGGDTDIGRPGSRVRVLVIRAREDLEMARQVRALLAREQAENRDG